MQVREENAHRILSITMQGGSLPHNICLTVLLPSSQCLNNNGSFRRDLLLVTPSEGPLISTRGH